jgi:hypothetical protein
MVTTRMSHLLNYTPTPINIKSNKPINTNVSNSVSKKNIRSKSPRPPNKHPVQPSHPPPNKHPPSNKYLVPHHPNKHSPPPPNKYLVPHSPDKNPPLNKHPLSNKYLVPHSLSNKNQIQNSVSNKNLEQDKRLKMRENKGKIVKRVGGKKIVRMVKPVNKPVNKPVIKPVIKQVNKPVIKPHLKKSALKRSGVNGVDRVNKRRRVGFVQNTSYKTYVKDADTNRSILHPNYQDLLKRCYMGHEKIAEIINRNSVHKVLRSTDNDEMLKVYDVGAHWWEDRSPLILNKKLESEPEFLKKFLFLIDYYIKKNQNVGESRPLTIKNNRIKIVFNNILRKV